MGSEIEETVKALTEFESELDIAKATASESRRRILNEAAEWAESARAQALSKAQQLASELVSKARSEAEGDAAEIRERGARSLRTFEASISKKKGKAVERAVALLLGELK